MSFFKGYGSKAWAGMNTWRYTLEMVPVVGRATDASDSLRKMFFVRRVRQRHNGQVVAHFNGCQYCRFWSSGICNRGIWVWKHLCTPDFVENLCCTLEARHFAKAGVFWSPNGLTYCDILYCVAWWQRLGLLLLQIVRKHWVRFMNLRQGGSHSRRTAWQKYKATAVRHSGNISPGRKTLQICWNRKHRRTNWHRIGCSEENLNGYPSKQRSGQRKTIPPTAHAFFRNSLHGKPFSTAMPYCTTSNDLTFLT